MDCTSRKGFTLVELLIVIVVIGILAGLVSMGYPTWRKSTIETTMKNDLVSFASAMESERNFNNGYPSSVPAGFTTSKDNVLQLVGATNNYYCADVFSTTDIGSVMSYRSDTKDYRTTPCSGLVNGTVGGAAPGAPRGVNLLGDFADWTVTGTATISGGVLTLGTNGTARSPIIRVNSPRLFTVGGDMKGEQQSVNVSLQPDAGFHASSAYYAADGVTAVQNTGGHTGNGCAERFTLSGWQNDLRRCTWWPGGPNVIYMRLIFNSSASGYSSPDLQIRNPIVILTD